MEMKVGLSCLGWEVGRLYGMHAGEARNSVGISSHVVEKERGVHGMGNTTVKQTARARISYQPASRTDDGISWTDKGRCRKWASRTLPPRSPNLAPVIAPHIALFISKTN